MLKMKRRKPARSDWKQNSHVNILSVETRGATKTETARSGDIHNYVWDNRRNDWRLVSVDHVDGGTTFITESVSA